MRATLTELADTSVKAASASYAFAEKRLHSAYRETKHVTGTVVRRGWRPLIPWMFIALGAVIIYRIGAGLPLVDVAQLLAALGGLGVPAMLGQWTRSNEAVAGVANGPPSFGLAGGAGASMSNV